MKLSVMTLGCPAWDLDTILGRANEYGYDAIDFRGLQGNLDITVLPEFTTHAAATKRRIADQGLEVSCISSSISVCDSTKRQANLDEAKRTIAVATALRAPNVRVFGNGEPNKIGHVAAATIGRDCVREILALDGAKNLHWLFETHDHWIRSSNCKLLLDAIADSAFGALWDLGHTYRVEKETPVDTWAAIGPRIGYAHVKDAVHNAAGPGDGWRYVLPGTGQLPLAEGVQLLKKNGYNGYLTFEHEKRWHPTLEEPEVAFPAFVRWAKPLLA